MYLKTLEIQGFKSFPEKTVIEFHQGITAIVGPNGSGKSNVTDAIRWVLGEQSIKTLRGAKMEDVIFTGTQSRRAMGYAEVTMVIDNSDSKMNIEYSEVSVTRRLYRSGESEYFLNKTSCRLKDVLTLFMDTGLGRDGYSIVGQGRVDEILSNKSEDRRKVFEEASGIVKFKSRKDESERKLNNTQQNLLRINDIITELETQIEPLREQSTTARQFLLYRDELKGLEVALFLENIEKYTAKQNEYKEEYDSIALQMEQETFKLEEMKSQNRDFTDKIKALEEAISEKKEQLQEVIDNIKDFNSEIQINKDRIEGLLNRIKSIEDEGTSFDDEIGRIQEELKTRGEKEKYLNKQLLQYNEKLATYENEMKSIIETLNESEKKAEAMKLRTDELIESLYDKKGQAGQTRAQTKMLDSREKTLDSDIATLISDRDSLSIQKEECEEKLQKINQSNAQNTEKLETYKSDLENAKINCTQISMKIETKKLDYENIKYRIKTLTELEKNREGYSETVKAIMSKALEEKDFAIGIRGTVGELISVTKEYETAIEIALGNSVQNIVTDTEKTASAIIEHLKQNKLGRATFLPISSISGRSLENEYLTGVRKMPGFIGIAKDLVEAPGDIKGIIDNLLGRIVIADVLPNAINMAKRFGYSFRIVTLEGDVVNPGGSLTGGYQRTRGIGILGRAREIEQLEQDVVTIKAYIDELADSLPKAENELTRKARDLHSFEQTMTANSHEKIREESRLAQIMQDITRCVGRIGMQKAEQEQLAKQREEIVREADMMDKESVVIEEEISVLKSELEKIEVSNKEEQESRDELRELISDLKLSVNSIEESLIAAKEMTERIDKEKQSFINNIEKRKEEQKKSDSDINVLELKNNELIVLIEAKSEQRDKITEEINALSNEKNEHDEKMSTFYDRFEELSNKISELTLELGKSEVKKGRMETALDEVKNKLWEQYELTYDNAQKWKMDIDNPTAALKRVNELKTSIKSLGDINVNSIEEYDKVSERYEFLKKQRDDIELSKQKLLKMITDITEEMKKQFISHFKIINENFKVVFSELFGGGMAEIILGNEDDVLNCNIDIHAQPPGKKLQNMLLLSGGERCLTAIALLFAILKLRPSPFCVLDEIEAALDDANIARFSEYIRNYSEESQFILVTHRKGTMESADMIYGVTMQERGISKILSMRLSD